MVRTVPVADPGDLVHQLRGPGPLGAVEFTLTQRHGSSALQYSGELGTDFGAAGQWWGSQVAKAWEAAVHDSFASIRAEAERRARPGSPDH